MERDDWVEEEEDAEADEAWHGESGGLRQRSGPASIDVNEVKKGS